MSVSSTEEYLTEESSETILVCSLCGKEEEDIDICTHCDIAICDTCQTVYGYSFTVCATCGEKTHWKDGISEDEKCEEASSYPCGCEIP
jgi:hypothetical protein